MLPSRVRPAEHGDDGVPLITDRWTARCTDLFNVANELLLHTLQRYFAHTEETEEQLSTLAHAAIGLMVRVLRPLGGLITTLPVGPDRDAAWVVLEERLRVAATFCGALQDDCDALTAGRLAPIRDALAGIADSLAADQADRGDSSALAEHDDEEVVMSADAGSVSFANDVQPLFRAGDRNAMKFAFDLGSYDDVKRHADAILARSRTALCRATAPGRRTGSTRSAAGSGAAWRLDDPPHPRRVRTRCS